MAILDKTVGDNDFWLFCCCLDRIVEVEGSFIEWN